MIEQTYTDRVSKVQQALQQQKTNEFEYNKDILAANQSLQSQLEKQNEETRDKIASQMKELISNPAKFIETKARSTLRLPVHEQRSAEDHAAEPQQPDDGRDGLALRHERQSLDVDQPGGLWQEPAGHEPRRRHGHHGHGCEHAANWIDDAADGRADAADGRHGAWPSGGGGLGLGIPGAGGGGGGLGFGGASAGFGSGSGSGDSGSGGSDMFGVGGFGQGSGTDFSSFGMSAPAASFQSLTPGLSNTAQAAGGVAGKWLGAASGAITGGLGILSAYHNSDPLSGAASGIEAGAAVGSLFGPVGTAVGGIVGAVGGLLAGVFGDKGKGQAQSYDTDTIQPGIASELRQFNSGSLGYDQAAQYFDQAS